MYCIHMAQDIFKLLSRPNSPIVPRFLELKCSYQIPNSLSVGELSTQSGQICDFRLKSSNCYWTLTGSCRQLSSLCQFRWPWVTLKGGTCGLKFFKGISIKVAPLTQRDQIWKITWGRGVFPGGQPRLCPKEAEPQRSPVVEILLCLCIHPLSQNDDVWQAISCGGEAFPSFGVPYIYVYTLRRSMTEFGVVTPMGEGLVFRLSATPSIPRGRDPSGPQFWGSPPTCAYTVLSRATKLAW